MHISVQIVAGKFKMEFLPTISLTKAFPSPNIFETNLDSSSKMALYSIHCTQRCGDAYQGLSLINQCDGKLFMIGTHNGNSWGLGGDGADLYSLELDNDSIKV